MSTSTSTPIDNNNNKKDELSIVAQIYSEIMEALVEKMENRFVVGFSGAISIMLLTVEKLVYNKLGVLETLKGEEGMNNYDKNVIENDIQEIKTSLQRVLDRLG